MATKEPQTRRAFGEQGVSRWLPALACFALKAGARSVGAETPELDEEQKLAGGATTAPGEHASWNRVL